LEAFAPTKGRFHRLGRLQGATGGSLIRRELLILLEKISTQQGLRQKINDKAGGDRGVWGNISGAALPLRPPQRQVTPSARGVLLVVPASAAPRQSRLISNAAGGRGGSDLCRGSHSPVAGGE
jgi:hypothetical protein